MSYIHNLVTILVSIYLEDSLDSSRHVRGDKEGLATRAFRGRASLANFRFWAICAFAAIFALSFVSEGGRLVSLYALISLGKIGRRVSEFFPNPSIYIRFGDAQRVYRVI